MGEMDGLAFFPNSLIVTARYKAFLFASAKGPSLCIILCLIITCEEGLIPPTWCQAIDNIPLRLPCDALWPSSHLAGGARPMASIFHASPASITSLPAPVSAPRGQVFRGNTLQALARPSTPAGVFVKQEGPLELTGSSPQILQTKQLRLRRERICSRLVKK